MWPCTHWLSHWLGHSQYFYFWHTKSDPRNLWPLRHLIRVMRRHDLTEKDLPTNLRKHPQGAILDSCDNWDIWSAVMMTIRVFFNGAIIGTSDICDTDYNSDNWEPEFMTIFVIWQLIVTLDSIRNSCDVSSSFCVPISESKEWGGPFNILLTGGDTSTR